MVGATDNEDADEVHAGANQPLQNEATQKARIRE